MSNIGDNFTELYKKLDILETEDVSNEEESEGTELETEEGGGGGREVKSEVLGGKREL
jgi:hypothetical protein